MPMLKGRVRLGRAAVLMVAAVWGKGKGIGVVICHYGRRY